MENELIQFIKENLNEDTFRLALKSTSIEPSLHKIALEQIESRRKIKNKMPLWYDNFNLILPNSKFLEQSSSQLTAVYKAGLFDYEISLDCTGGTGIDSYFIAQRAKEHIITESNSKLAELLIYNFKKLGLDNLQIHEVDALKYLNNTQLKFDLIYIDPSRRNNDKRVYGIDELSPNLQIILPAAKEKSERILIKLSPMFDLDEIFNIFGDLEEIHILGVDNECKEILVSLKQNSNPPRLVINELKAEIAYELISPPEKYQRNYSTPLKYIYEPDNIVIKAGNYVDYYGLWGMVEIGKNTHLFTTDELISNFPGKVFEIMSIIKEDGNALRDVLGEHPRASIKSRNYPISSENLCKKHKIKDSEIYKIFATTLISNQKRLLICKKIS